MPRLHGIRQHPRRRAEPVRRGHGSGRVTRIDPVTGARTAVATGGLFFSPVGVAVEAGGGIVVADANAFGGGGVIRIHPATGAQTKLASGGTFTGPRGVAIVPRKKT